jgi:hypothetical protein
VLFHDLYSVYTAVVDGNIFDTILPTQRDGLSYYKNVDLRFRPRGHWDRHIPEDGAR